MKETMYYSQFKQDQFVNELFVKNSRGGYFVDVGAHDGITYSNSYFFETELRWNGICVEPLAQEYKKLTLNRSAIAINACAYSHDGTVNFTSVQDKQSPYRHSYNMLSGVSETHGTVDRVETFGLESTSMEMPCTRLQTVFSKHHVSHVDYLSIDTEGSEFEVLKGIDFSSVHINLIDVEHNFQEQQMEDIGRLLQGHGFQFVRNIECDAFFINSKLEWSWNLGS
jgi:FkbM family methyltransferase